MSIFEGHGNLDRKTEQVNTVWIPVCMGVREPQHLLGSSDFDIRPWAIQAEPCRRRGDSRTASPCHDLG